jgi:hypothetical protein
MRLDTGLSQQSPQDMRIGQIGGAIEFFHRQAMGNVATILPPRAVPAHSESFRAHVPTTRTA